MSRTVSLRLVVLVGMGVCLSLSQRIAADVGTDPSRSVEVRPDSLSLIHKGMTMKEVNRLLKEDFSCFHFGPSEVNVGPEDSWCYYRWAGLRILYQGGRVEVIEGRNAWRTGRR